MAKEIVKAPAPMLPGMRDEKYMSTLLDSFNVQSEARLIYINRFPDKDEIRALQARNAEIKKGLAPAEKGTQAHAEARVALALLFDGNAYLNGQNKADLLNAYMFVLQRYPLFAILGAVDDAMGGRIPKQDDRYVPNSVQMRAAAARHVEVHAREQIKIERILSAKYLLQQPNKPGDKARVAAALKDFKGRLSPVEGSGLLTDEDKRKLDDRRFKSNRKAILDQWKALGLDPIFCNGEPISPALARSTGALNGPEAAIREED